MKYRIYPRIGRTFFPEKWDRNWGCGYKRFDTSLICTRTRGSTVNWRFNVRFKLFLTYNKYNYRVLDLNNFFFPMKTNESLGCGQYAGAAYLRVNTVVYYTALDPYLIILNLLAFKTKNTWKQCVWQNMDQVRTNQNTQIYLRTTLSYSKTYYSASAEPSF